MLVRMDVYRTRHRTMTNPAFMRCIVGSVQPTIVVNQLKKERFF